MPQPTEHIAQAEKNERLYEVLIGTEFNDWAVTGLFYAALHYVDAYFVQQTSASPSNHRSRNHLVDSTRNLAQIKQDYAELYRLSLDVRYDLAVMSDVAVEEFRLKHFIPIRTHIRALLGIS